jgi:hypothetical protein
MYDPNNCPHISTLLRQKRDFVNTILIYGKGMPAKWDIVKGQLLNLLVDPIHVFIFQSHW